MKNLFRKYFHILILFMLLTITLFLYSSLCYIFAFSEEVTSLSSFIFTVLFTTLAGIISGRKADEKGWLWGLKGGMIFIFMTISLCLVCSGGNVSYPMMTGRIILYVFASFIGGIMGINLK